MVFLSAKKADSPMRDQSLMDGPSGLDLDEIEAELDRLTIRLEVLSLFAASFL